MKLTEFLTEASEVAQLPSKLKKLLKDSGWTITSRPVDGDRSFTARYKGTPEAVLQALTKGIAYLELHEMTWSGRDEGTAVYEVRGDGLTYFCEVRFWSVKRKPCAQLSFYRG